MLSTLILSALLSIFPTVFAQTSLSTVQGTCVTVLGKKSVANVGTTTHILTVKSSIHITTTVTPAATVYPSTEVTTTSTETAMTTYSTSKPVATDYYSSTSTNYQTTTVTVSTSTTATTTSTSTVFTTQTVTIPTSQGFVPVASGVGFPAKKRGLANRFDIEARKATVTTTAPALTTAASYPMTVTCDVLIEAFMTYSTVKTAKTTATVTAPPFTSTVMTTTTISTTTTIIPSDVQVTTIFVDEICATQTTTTTSTSLITATDIVTVAAPSATYYAACAPNNVVSSAGGSTFSGLQVSGTVQPAYWSQQASGYDCCVACITTANCAGSSFVDGRCTVYPVGGTSGTSGGTCNPNVYFADFFPFYIGDPYTISNGNCGQYAYGEGACYNRNGGFC